MVVMYFDNVIISCNKAEAGRIFANLERRGYKLTGKGTLEEYLGLIIQQRDNGSFPVSHNIPIDIIIVSIPGMKNVHSAKSPAVTGTVLERDVKGKIRKE